MPPRLLVLIQMTEAEITSTGTVRRQWSKLGITPLQCKRRLAGGGGGRNGLWERSLPFTHEYLKTINLGAAARKKYMKGKLISI